LGPRLDRRAPEVRAHSKDLKGVIAMSRWLFLLPIVSLAGAVGAADYTEAQRAELKKLYKDKCAVCHGEDGKAQTPGGKVLGARNHADPKWQASVTDQQLITSIKNGKGNMPKWGDELTEAQIRGIVEVVIRGFGAAK
jgi:mono/diheme cytochrome c family protein